MIFAPIIILKDNSEEIAVKILPAQREDFEKTKQNWQTDWTSDFIMDSQSEKYAVKTIEDELVALGAYEILPSSIVVHIIYLESQPESNPVITKKRKYSGIGQVLLAFGIKLSIDNGFGGDITFEAKTPELARHYIKDFGAITLPVFDSSMPPRLLVSGEAAKDIFSKYLK